MYRLLIVDDNYMQIQSVLTYIRWEDFGVDSIDVAQDGKEGLEIIAQKKPDIVITDVIMPIMDGIEMTRQARLVSPNTRFIYMSCHDDFEYLKKAMDHNVVSYILKPIDSEELKSSVEKLIAEIEAQKKYDGMDKFMQENLDIFRENFLYRLLYSAHLDTHYLEHTLHDLGFDKYASFLVAKIEIMSGAYSSYQLHDFIKKHLPDSITGYSVIESESCCVVVFMWEQQEQDNFLTAVTPFFDRLITAVKTESDASLRIGLSLAYHNLYEAQFMLDQASCALYNSLAADDKSIHTYANLPYAQIELDPVKLKEAIGLMLDASISASPEEFLDKYYPQNVYLKQNYVKTLCFSVVTTLQYLLLERNLNFNDLFDHSAVVWDKLDQFDTIKDPRQWLYNILNIVVAFIRDNEKNKYEKIAWDIMQCIDKNYQSISSIEDITENMYISASYAKRLFKQCTGKTIFDCLLAKRMEEAKRLLADPYIKAYEVAELVGYKSKAHFTETFRKYTGMTPKDFQQNPFSEK